jgi:hypothetical protein
MLPRRSEAGRDRLLQAYIACDGTVSLPQDSDGTMSARCTQKPTRHRASHFTIVEATSVNRTRYRYLRAYLEQGVYPHIPVSGSLHQPRARPQHAPDQAATARLHECRQSALYARPSRADGTDLGVLESQGTWRVVPHNLKLSQEILKLCLPRSMSTSIARSMMVCRCE